MKHLFIILLFPFYSLTQTISDTCFTTQELFSISTTLDSLLELSQINDKIISQQESIIKKQYSLIYLDSTQIALQHKQVVLLQETIDVYVKREKQLQPKWYDNKNIWFFSGILTTLGSGILINQLVK
jgi:hypothetical protein